MNFDDLARTFNAAPTTTSRTHAELADRITDAQSGGRTIDVDDAAVAPPRRTGWLLAGGLLATGAALVAAVLVAPHLQPAPTSIPAASDPSIPATQASDVGYEQEYAQCADQLALYGTPDGPQQVGPQPFVDVSGVTPTPLAAIEVDAMVTTVMDAGPLSIWCLFSLGDGSDSAILESSHFVFGGGSDASDALSNLTPGHVTQPMMVAHDLPPDSWGDPSAGGLPLSIGSVGSDIVALTLHYAGVSTDAVIERGTYLAWWPAAIWPEYGPTGVIGMTFDITLSDGTVVTGAEPVPFGTE